MDLIKFSNKVLRKRIKSNHEKAKSLEEILNATAYIGEPKNDNERNFLKHACKVYDETIEELNNYMTLIEKRCNDEKEKEE